MLDSIVSKYGESVLAEVNRFYKRVHQSLDSIVSNYRESVLADVNCFNESPLNIGMHCIKLQRVRAC